MLVEDTPKKLDLSRNYEVAVIIETGV